MKLIKLSSYNNAVQLFSFISFFFVYSSVFSAPIFTRVDLNQPLSQAGLPDIAVADLNQDGNMDLVISEYNVGDGTAAIEFLFGDGTGQKFSDQKTIKAKPNAGDGLPYNPNGIAIGYFNGDNILDIAVTAAFSVGTRIEPGGTRTININQVTTIYPGLIDQKGYNVNTAALIELTTITAAYDVAIGDFNKDTFADVVISDKIGLNLFLGSSTGISKTPKVFATDQPAYDIQLQLNNRGYLDIITDHEIFFNNTPAIKSDITFISKALYSGNNNPISVLVAVTAADFNGDSIVDVAYALNYPQSGITPPSSSIAVILSTGSGMNVVYTKKETPIIPNSVIEDIATADLDLDGVADVITLDNSQDAMHIYTGYGDGSFALPTTSKITPATGAATRIKPKLLVITDIDSNLYPDIYTANDTNNATPSLSILLQQKGTENFVFAPKDYIVPIPLQTSISLPVKVLRKYPLTAPTTINYTVVEGSAKNGFDFIAPMGPTNLKFDTGKLSLPILIEVLATNNPNSNFTIDLKNTSNILLDTATIALQSGAATPTLKFFASNFNLNEDPSITTAKITVIRSPTNTLSVTTVDVNSADITNPDPAILKAIETTDYTKLVKTLTFASGVDSLSFTIPIVDDSLDEGDEKFIINLLNVTNGQITTPAATVTIIDNDAALPPVNNIPVANPDSYTVAKNKTLTVDFPGVLSNDTDADKGATLKSSLAAGSSLAGLTLNLDGSFTYKPTQDFTGTVTFDYVANDGKDDSQPTTVTIDVTNTKPTVSDDSYSVHMNLELVVDLPGVLKNDLDDNGDSLTVSLAQGSTLVGLTLLPDGSFKYKAQGVGSVSFDYVANDGVVDSLPATVTINITNTKPIANPDNYSAEQNKLLTIPVKGILSNDIDNDKDPLTAKIAPGSALTGLTLATNDGSFTYQPPLDFTGEVTFQYIANDGGEDSMPTTVTINVYPATQLNFGIFSLDTTNSYSVSEDTGELVLNVVRNSGSSGQVILSYKLTDNLAKGGIDFNDNSATPGTLTFADGVKSMPITIGIVKDTEIDPNEDFLISLTSVDSGVLANLDTSKVVTITDSAGIFSLDSNNVYTVSEETGMLDLVIVRDFGATGEAVVKYSIVEIEAKLIDDFNDKTTTPGTLIFANGVTSMTIALEVLKDTVAEGDETFTVKLDSVAPQGAIGTTNFSGIVTITDSGSTTTPTPPVVTSGGGGGCTLQLGSSFDPTFPLLIFLSLLYVGRRERISRNC
jgi:hypothetical protein